MEDGGPISNNIDLIVAEGNAGGENRVQLENLEYAIYTKSKNIEILNSEKILKIQENIGSNKVRGVGVLAHETT